MKLLFVCSGGMSSAIVESALHKEAEKRGMTIETKAVGTTDFDGEVHKGWDIALVAPQVKHRFESFKKSADDAGVPILVIPPRSYSPLGGPSLMKTILDKLGG